MWKRIAFTATACALASVVFHDPAVRLRIIDALRHRYRATRLQPWQTEFEALAHFRRMAKITDMMFLAGNKPKVRL